MLHLPSGFGDLVKVIFTLQNAETQKHISMTTLAKLSTESIILLKPNVLIKLANKWLRANKYMRVSSFGHANDIVCTVEYSCNKTDEGELLRKK